MLATIGYEGARPDDFVATLRRVEVDVVVDIRDRAQSRRPGFSKSALSENLRLNGIRYVHLRQLGDPKSGRDAARAGDLAKFRKIYAAVLETSEAKHALAQIADLASSMTVCLLCYERDYSECHRKIVADQLESVVGSKVRHLGVQTDVAISEHGGRMRNSSEGAAA